MKLGIRIQTSNTSCCLEPRGAREVLECKPFSVFSLFDPFNEEWGPYETSYKLREGTGTFQQKMEKIEGGHV